MKNSPKTLASGTLEADRDSWLLAAEHVIALDVEMLKDFDASLEHEAVSVVGTMGIPRSSNSTKLIVEKLASHRAIRSRACGFYESGQGGSAADHWLRAERELLST
jgi:hypothetical protein